MSPKASTVTFQSFSFSQTPQTFSCISLLVLVYFFRQFVAKPMVTCTWKRTNKVFSRKSLFPFCRYEVVTFLL